jgi:hypothetical protein
MFADGKGERISLRFSIKLDDDIDAYGLDVHGLAGAFGVLQSSHSVPASADFFYKDKGVIGRCVDGRAIVFSTLLSC